MNRSAVSRPWRRRGSAAPSVVTAFALTGALLAGCSSSDASVSAPDTSDCDSTETVRFLLGTADLDVSYIPYAILADQLGYFAQECIEADIQASLQGAQALIGGQTDFVMTNPDEMIIQAETEQLPMKMVYNLVPELSLQVAVANGSPITSAEQLKGKKVGIPATALMFDNYMQKLMSEYGGSLADVTWVNTGYGATSMESLKSGDLDAVLAWPGLFTSFELAGYDFTMLPDPDWMDDYDGIGWAALSSYVEEKPEVVEGVSRAIAKSSVYLQKNPEEAIRIFWEAYPERAPLPGADEDTAMANDLAVLATTLRTMRVDPAVEGRLFGEQTLERWTSQVEYDRSGGLVTKELDPASFFYTEQIPAANEFDHDAIGAE